MRDGKERRHAQIPLAARTPPWTVDPVHTGRIRGDRSTNGLFITDRAGQMKVALNEVGDLPQLPRGKIRVFPLVIMAIGFVKPKRDDVFSLRRKFALAPVDVVPQILPGGETLLPGNARLRVVQFQPEGRDRIIVLVCGSRQRFAKPFEGFRVLGLIQAQQILRLFFQMI
jgi:hypothetical protein